jgi:trehalose 6-phosphate phosphatase
MQAVEFLAEMAQGRRQGRKLLLLLDYDGTLVEIAPRPELAAPTPALLELLARLIHRSDYAVVVVSGRSLENLRNILPLPGLNYLGSHGGESLIPGKVLPAVCGDAVFPEISRWKKELAGLLEQVSGWWLEDKPQGFALHYRQTSPEHEAQLTRIADVWKSRVLAQGSCQILHGKKVIEVLPRGISKGGAIRNLLLSPDFAGYFPLYVGDDTTDDSVRAAIQTQGLFFKVGEEEHTAKAVHFLKNPAQVREFLVLLAGRGEEQP